MRNSNYDMSEIYNLFLDDERIPIKVTWIELPMVNWTIIRDYMQFVKIIQVRSIPNYISFDHDLGPNAYKECSHNDDGFNYSNLKGEKTGYDCAKFLVDHCLKNKLNFPDYTVHSMNPIGKQNIISLIENYKKFKAE